MAGFLDIQVTTSGAREAADRLAHAAVSERLAQAVAQWSEQSLSSLREVTPVRTGEMQKGWRADEGILSATITNPVPYAIFVVQGTKPHEIRPQNPAGFLAFMVGDETIYTRLVRHPGQVANPFLQDRLDRMPQTALEALTGATQRLVHAMVGA